MGISLYLDVHVPKVIRDGLCLREVNVLTAQEDGSARLSDPELLDRATFLNRILVTFDSDLLVEAQLRQQFKIFFAGVIYAHSIRLSIGQKIEQLEIVAKVSEPEDLINKVLYLPI
jgi:predicted nuclease of predicted toxin-antitoxin system